MVQARDVAAKISLLSDAPRDESFGVYLQKLTYYVQSWSMAIRGSAAHAEATEAWKHGPVVRSLWQEVKYDPSTALYEGRDFDLGPVLDPIIELVMVEYGNIPAFELVEMTHYESPWLNARRGLGPEDQSNNIVSLGDMESHFKSKSLAGLTAPELALSLCYDDSDFDCSFNEAEELSGARWESANLFVPPRIGNR